MVIGNSFVWAHFGKTGGDSVHKMFKCVNKKEIIFSDPITSRAKHRNFSYREKELNLDLTTERKRIMNIRHLPSWALSYAFHMKRMYNIPVDKDLMIQGYISRKPVWMNPENTDDLPIQQIKVDEVLEKFMCGRVDYWLRTECLAEDFIKVFSRFLRVSFLQKMRIKRIKTNVNNDYVKSIKHYFTRNEIDEMYANCPLWGSTEETVYRNIILEKNK